MFAELLARRIGRSGHRPTWGWR